jgi:hypothetical protein
MTRRRWLALMLGVLVVGAIGTRLALPGLIRRVAIARIEAITHRRVNIEAVDLDVLKGRLAFHRFRLAERDGQSSFADFEQLEVRLNLRALLRGHLWVHDLVLRNPTVHVVRLPTTELNLSDLVQGAGDTGRTFDVTVDRAALVGGTVTLEDQALPERRTWASENISIQARNLSTRRDDGTAVATSVTGGVPVSIDITHLRLYPIHLEGSVQAEGVDLALARLYLPPDAPFVLDRGRANTSVRVKLDASEGVSIDADVRLLDVALVRPAGRETAAVAPELTARVVGLSFGSAGVRLGQLEVGGSMAVPDPTMTAGGRLHRTSVHAHVADFTWPVSGPARLDVSTTVPGGGQLTVAGTLQPPGVPSDLRLQLVGLDLAPWARLLPTAARLTGIAEADLRVSEPLTQNLPARVRGSIAVNRLGVADAQRTLLSAARVEAAGLRVQLPAHFTVERLLVIRPSAIVERDQGGSFPLVALVGPSAGSVAVTRPTDASLLPNPSPPTVSVRVREIVTRDGAIAWRDRAVTPQINLDASRIETTVTGASWPLHGPLDARMTLRPPGGGQVRIAGRVGLDPFTAELRVTMAEVALAPYQGYLGTPAHISGWADLEADVVHPAPGGGSTTVRGRGGLSRLDVRDGERTVMRVERAAAAGLEVDWPRRVTARDLTLQRPWLLVERDDAGALPLRALLTSGTGTAARTASGQGDDKAEAVAVTIGRVVAEDGGMRIVDRSVSPAFAVDLQRAAVVVEGLSTAGPRPARLELKGQLGPNADLALRGTVGLFDGPLRIDVSGDLRRFAVPRANPYLQRHIAWRAEEGFLATTLTCRIQGDALEARTDLRLSRLQVTRAAGEDESQARIGLPLGLVLALMKDARGDIRMSVPVGGRLSDPRFDFSETIWSAVRTVAINAITLPVSWIGRVRLGSDSRIQRVEVDGIRFQPGTAVPTSDGQAQLARVAAFLEQMTEVRMALAPVVSSRDREELWRLGVRASIDRLAREAQIEPKAAAARLFKQRFPDRLPPESDDGLLAALTESPPALPAEASALAAGRLESVRTTLRQAGIDPARLLETKSVQRQEAVEEGIELALVEPEPARRPGLLNLLQRLGATKRGEEPPDE